MVQQDDLNIPAIATVGVVAVAMTIAAVLAVQTLYLNYAQAEIQRKVVEAPTANSDSRLAEQRAQLARYSWADAESGVTTIPIERAMRLVVDELRAEQQETSQGGNDARG